MGSIPYETEQQWHDIRAKHVGASEVAALFGLSSWLTRWQLYMQKAGKLPGINLDNNTAVTAGKFMENGIRLWAEDKFSITLQKTRRYITHENVRGMGASLDFEQVGTGSRIPVEMKFSQWGDGWDWDGEDLTEIPEAYLLQTQHQMACAGAKEAKLIAFVGGDLRMMTIPRSARICDSICTAVMKFWDDVASGTEPPIDFSADADAVNRLAYISKLRSVVLQPEMEPVFAAYDKARTERLAAEKLEEAKKTELLKAIIDAGEGNDTCVATCLAWKMKVVKIAENPGREILAADVGTRVGGKKGHNRLYVSKEDAK